MNAVAWVAVERREASKTSLHGKFSEIVADRRDIVDLSEVLQKAPSTIKTEAPRLSRHFVFLISDRAINR